MTRSKAQKRSSWRARLDRPSSAHCKWGPPDGEFDEFAPVRHRVSRGVYETPKRVLLKRPLSSKLSRARYPESCVFGQRYGRRISGSKIRHLCGRRKRGFWASSRGPSEQAGRVLHLLCPARDRGREKFGPTTPRVRRTTLWWVRCPREGPFERTNLRWCGLSQAIPNLESAILSPAFTKSSASWF